MGRRPVSHRGIACGPRQDQSDSGDPASGAR
jgi:hypothetical protein